MPINESGSQVLPGRAPNGYAFVGSLYLLPNAPSAFSGWLRRNDASSAWCGFLDRWYGLCAHIDSGHNRQIADLSFDPQKCVLMLTVSGSGLRPMKLTLRRSPNRPTEWVGRCELVGSDEGPRPCRLSLMELPDHWDNGDGILREFAALEAFEAAEARAIATAAARAQSRVIYGPHPLDPAMVPDTLASAFGKRVVELSAERLIRFCRRRKLDARQDPWDPFSMLAFVTFCGDSHLARPIQSDDWLEGLVDPLEEYGLVPTGGGWLVRMPDGMIGITEGFLERLAEHMRSKAG